MSPIKNQLVDVIEILPETEQILLLEIAKRFISGETVSHSDIDWS